MCTHTAHFLPPPYPLPPPPSLYRPEQLRCCALHAIQLEVKCVASTFQFATISAFFAIFYTARPIGSLLTCRLFIFILRLINWVSLSGRQADKKAVSIMCPHCVGGRSIQRLKIIASICVFIFFFYYCFWLWISISKHSIRFDLLPNCLFLHAHRLLYSILYRAIIE